MKILKYKFFLIAVLLFGACDPLEDEIAVIEAENSIPTDDIEYTLTEDDYETADEVCECAGFGSFSDVEDVKIGVPAVLADVFPALGNGSSAIVTYDLFRGFTAPEAEAFLDAADDARHTVTEADYAGVSSDAGQWLFFNNTTTLSDNVQGILNNAFPNATDGDIVAVTYNKSETEYSDISFVESFNENFGDVVGTSDFGDMQSISIEGDEVWENDDSSSGYNYGGMSGFGGDADNKDWMITPMIDLDGIDKPNLKLNHVLNFFDESASIGTEVAVMISTDYTGDAADVGTAIWTAVDLDAWPAGDSWDQFDSQASLEDYAGDQIYIGFYYQNTLPDQTHLWRITNIIVDEGEVDVSTNNEFFSYSASTSSWSANDGAYFMNSSDFDAMGLRFPNFSSSNRAENFLPQFLATTLAPFAQEEDVISIIYDYFSSSSGIQVRADQYTLTNGEWIEWASTVQNELGFAHDGTGWIADNTIKYTLTGDDYTSIATAYESSNPDGSGSMSTFGNYDIGLWSSTEIFDSITTRLDELFGPVPAGQKYLVSYAVWKPGNDVFELNVIYDGSSWSLVGE